MTPCQDLQQIYLRYIQNLFSKYDRKQSTWAVTKNLRDLDCDPKITFFAFKIGKYGINIFFFYYSRLLLYLLLIYFNIQSKILYKIIL